MPSMRTPSFPAVPPPGHPARMIERRSVLALLAAAAAAPLRAGNAPAPARPGLRAQRLSWAGVRLEGDATSLFLDPWITPAVWDGAWTRPVVPLAADAARRGVLPTHLHNDHFDPAAAREVLGDKGTVLCEAGMSAAVASRGFRVRALPLWQPESFGDFAIVPVPASDGFGDAQVSWIVSGGGRRVIHCGDTAWHARFDVLGRAYGPFDAAFLPVNGALVERETPDPGVPRVLTPEQAAAAADQLRARLAVPIHYGFSGATYREHVDARGAFERACRARGVAVSPAQEGDWIAWS
jgi:L-ascorbate metabolism protein UlaG (beta-lactamase superfamily)